MTTIAAVDAPRRNQPVTALMSADEKQQLNDYAQHRGQSMSQIVRESVLIYINARQASTPRRRRRLLRRRA